MAKRRYFGTDGIRGRVGEAPITPDFVLKLGWAAGKVLSDKHCRQVLIGKDTRISGYMFESALEAGLSAAGIDTRLLGPMPTPAIAYLTRTLGACAGIVISASHNPYHDNGIKFFSSQGTKLPGAMELAIEAQLDQPLTTVASDQLGKAKRVVDAAGRYIEFCKSTLPLGTSLKGLKLVVDCAHGAAYHIAGNVFQELGAEVIVMGNQPDGLNINEGVGATQPQALQARVVAKGADVGIALDGDADRLIMVDETGQCLDGDQLLYILAVHFKQQGRLEGGVVGTLMSNLGLEQAITDMGLEFVRSKVGDRYVNEALEARGWLLGGESSGHILWRSVATTGDGIINALQVLAAMLAAKRSLSSLAQGMTLYPQTLINVKVGDKEQALAHPQVTDALADINAQLGERGRVLLRPSGTEPVIRVMVEGQDAQEIQAVAEQLASQVRDCA